MKKFSIIMIALLVLALGFAGCGSGGKVNPDPSGSGEVPVATAQTTPQIADGTGYDNSVVINNGTVEGTTFNWQFFVGKSGAGRAADVKIINKQDGKLEEMTLRGGTGSFTLERKTGEYTYTYMISFTADFPADSAYSMAEFCVLTNNPDISAEQFFNGSVPEDARVGDLNEHGIVVFTNYVAR